MKKIYARLMKLVNFVGYPIRVQILKGSHRVRVLIIAENSVVLVKSSIGTQRWSLPGGGIKKNETPQNAAAREVFEETNLKIDPKDFSILAEKFIPIQQSNESFRVTFLVARLSAMLPTAVIRPLEVLETDWFPLDSLPEGYSPTVDIALELLNVS